MPVIRDQKSVISDQEGKRHWKDQLQRFASPPPKSGPIAGSHYRKRACGQARPRHARDTCKTARTQTVARKVKSLLHNVKDHSWSKDHSQPSPAGKTCHFQWVARQSIFLAASAPSSFNLVLSAPRGARGTWWSQTGSNRRPPACKAGALPTELWPRSGGRSQIVSPGCHIRILLLTTARGTGGPG
jgi:hypothetical protein